MIGVKLIYYGSTLNTLPIPILYDRRGYYGLHFLHILGPSTPQIRSGIHVLLDILGFQDSPHTFIALNLPLRGAIYYNVIVSFRGSSPCNVHYFPLIFLEAGPCLLCAVRWTHVSPIFCEVDLYLLCSTRRTMFLLYYARQTCITYAPRGGPMFLLYSARQTYISYAITHITHRASMELSYPLEVMIPSSSWLLA